MSGVQHCIRWDPRRDAPFVCECGVRFSRLYGRHAAEHLATASYLEAPDPLDRFFVPSEGVWYVFLRDGVAVEPDPPPVEVAPVVREAVRGVSAAGEEPGAVVPGCPVVTCEGRVQVDEGRDGSGRRWPRWWCSCGAHGFGWPRSHQSKES